MSETGRILIEKLDIYAYHGFFSEEERLGQRFVLDLVLDADLRAAAASDRLTDTVDYGRAVTIVAEAFTAFFWAPEWAPALSITLLLIILVAFPNGFGNTRKA